MRPTTPDRRRARTAARRAVIAAALLGALAARADRPLVSETADVIERGACQAEAAAATNRITGLPRVREIGAVITCGTVYDTQPALGYTRATGGGTREEALLLGAKTTIVAPTGDRPGFGVAYSVGALKVPGSAWRREELALTALATVGLAKGLLGHANLGTSRSRSARQNTTTWAIGAETVGDFTIAADVFGDDRDRPWASAGAGMVLGKGLSVNAAVATQFTSPRPRQLSVGAKIQF